MDNPDRTLSIFVDSFNDYNYRLRKSILNARDQQGRSWKWNPSYYTYIILDGEKCSKLICKLRGPIHRELGIRNSDFNTFKDCIKYGGKGTTWRDNWHLHDVKIRMEGIKPLNKDNGKLRALADIWEDGKGVMVLKVGQGYNHYEACSREYSIIKAVGLDNLANVINGSCFGDMKYNWKKHEILNFGNMILFNCLMNVVTDGPTLIEYDDIISKS